MKSGIPLVASAGQFRHVEEVTHDETIPSVIKVEEIYKNPDLVFNTYQFPEDWIVCSSNQIKAVRDNSLFVVRTSEAEYCYYEFRNGAVLTKEPLAISYDTDDLKTFSVKPQIPLR